MTRRDYVKIAAALAESQPHAKRESEHWAQWSEDRRRIADVLQSDNPRFDRERFNAATKK